jgi:hypothetical protein
LGNHCCWTSLAVVYLQHVGLFETVLDAFKTTFIHVDTEEEAFTLIEYDQHVAEVLRVVDNIRDAVRQANAFGKIIFGPRRPEAKESEGEGTDSSTLHLLSDLVKTDHVVLDDRAFNKECFVEDGKGHRARVTTSLDLIEELCARQTLTVDERRALRYRLRTSGALLVPVEGAELTAAAMRNKQNQSPEFRAICESIDLARLAEMPRFPAEMPWFVAVNAATKSAIMEIWNKESDPERAESLANAILDVSPRPEDWIACWQGNPPPQWIEAVKRVTIASLALPIELSDHQVIHKFNVWLERSVLSPLRELSPERYQAVIEHLRTFVQTPWERNDGH